VSAGPRNVLIVLALALAVYAVPGGGDTASFIGALLSTAILGALIFIVVRLYREHRLELWTLSDRWRGILYGAIGAAVFAMAARDRLWDTGAGTLLWLAVIGTASYALVLVWRQYRSLA
jgi:hypothetical protein